MTTKLGIVIHESGARLLTVDVEGQPFPFVIATLSRWEAKDLSALTGQIVSDIILTHNNQQATVAEQSNVVQISRKDVGNGKG